MANKGMYIWKVPIRTPLKTEHGETVHMNQFPTNIFEEYNINSMKSQYFSAE